MNTTYLVGLIVEREYRYYYYHQQQEQSALHHYDIGLLGVLFFGNLAGNFVVVPPVKSYHAVVYLT